MELTRIFTETRWKWIGLITLAVLGGLLSLAVVGSVRYDGPEGLMLRVRSEFAPRRDHPQFVPTPLAAPGGDPAKALALVLVASPSPTAQLPTATPSPKRPKVTPAVTRRPVETDAEDVPRRADLPTVTPTATPTATPTTAPTDTPLPPPPPPPPALDGPALPAALLGGIKHYWQTWNNCGPATLTMNLSYYGLPVTQAEAAKVLKPNKDDKNVSPDQIAAYARSQGLNATVRVNGDSDRLRRLVSAGVPVLVETWLDHDGGMGHYRLVTGYDDAAGEWTVYDSYVSEGIDPKGPYPGIRIPYDQMDSLWHVFNRLYVVVYDEARAAAVQEILGAEQDDAAMWQRALERAQAGAQQTPGDAYTWFNLGSSLAAQGRFADAATAFDQARVIGLPWRMLWYQFSPFQAYFEAGRIDELIALADATIATVGNIEETYYWKGKGLQARGDAEGARQNYRRAVDLNSNYPEAAAALAELGG